MWSKSIIVKEPRKPAWQAPICLVSNQQELNTYLNNVPFKQGQLVTTCYDKNNIEPIRMVNQLWVVVGFQTDYDKLTHDYMAHNGFKHPNAVDYINILQHGPYLIRPHHRWDSTRVFRALLPEEVNDIVVKNFDYISNYCKEHAGLVIEDPRQTSNT